MVVWQLSLADRSRASDPQPKTYWVLVVDKVDNIHIGIIMSFIPTKRNPKGQRYVGESFAFSQAG